MRTLALASLAVIGVLALAGCSSSSGSTPTTTVTAGASASPVVGSWGENTTGKPSITIASDGSFNGTDGCNTLVGHGTISGEKIEFGHFVTTLMACPDVDTWLSKATSATADGSTLTVLGSDGQKLGTLDQR